MPKDVCRIQRGPLNRFSGGVTRHWLRYSLKSFEWQKCKMIYWWANNYFFNDYQRFDSNYCKTDPDESLLDSNDGDLKYRPKNCDLDLLSDHRTTIRVALEPWYWIRFGYDTLESAWQIGSFATLNFLVHWSALLALRYWTEFYTSRSTGWDLSLVLKRI